jgi:hypothetical protein
VTGLIRFTFSALFVSTVLAGIASFYPQWAVALGVDFWNIPALERQVEETERASNDLDEWGHTIFDRIVAKRRVTRDVLEGRLSLLEAAIRFRDLNAQRRPNPVSLRDAYPGRTDAERVCRQVISWVVAEAQFIDPQQAKTVVASLERELEQRLAGGKTISWPDEQTP